MEKNNSSIQSQSNDLQDILSGKSHSQSCRQLPNFKLHLPASEKNMINLRKEKLGNLIEKKSTSKSGSWIVKPTATFLSQSREEVLHTKTKVESFLLG